MRQDSVTFTLSAEDWIATRTARVAINVEAAVSGNAASTARSDMLKAVESLGKADWKLTSFSRSQDQTGLERWSAGFEARLPENALGGLHDAAKKAGRAGLQLTVASIDFSPTLDETESARAALRTRIYKSAAEQLASLNASLPGRNYRIAGITFMDRGMPQSSYAMNDMTAGKRRMVPMAVGAMAPAEMDVAAPMERSEKMSVSALVELSALPPPPQQQQQPTATGGEVKR